jgi:hypothetical protein
MRSTHHVPAVVRAFQCIAATHEQHSHQTQHPRNDVKSLTHLPRLRRVDSDVTHAVVDRAQARRVGVADIPVRACQHSASYTRTQHPDTRQCVRNRLPRPPQLTSLAPQPVAARQCRVGYRRRGLSAPPACAGAGGGGWVCLQARARAYTHIQSFHIHTRQAHTTYEYIDVVFTYHLGGAHCVDAGHASPHLRARVCESV